jgi:hypothetical protein
MGFALMQFIPCDAFCDQVKPGRFAIILDSHDLEQPSPSLAEPGHDRSPRKCGMVHGLPLPSIRMAIAA